MEQLERATRKYGTFVWIPMAYYKWAHMLCKLRRGLQVLSTEIILLYRKDVETRPIGRANPQQSRPGQFLRLPTTWLVLQGAPWPPEPGFHSLGSRFYRLLLWASLLPSPLLNGSPGFPVSFSWLLQSHRFLVCVCVFRLWYSKKQRKKKKAMEIQENTVSEWASKQVNIILLFKFLKYF